MPQIKKIVPVLLLLSLMGYSQQDPQFTQYMYNTMTVNPGYTGSRGHLAILSLYRDQWVGIDGAPRTITFGLDSPVGRTDGLGISIIQDELGPSEETYIDANYAHNIILNRNGDRLSFGIKAGTRFFSLDWSKGLFRDPEAIFNENVNSRLLPTVGAGVFYYSNKAYLGLSTPNFFNNEHYDEIQESEALERMHFFLIGGYVFDVNPFLKFKPSFFAKKVLGAPLSVDVSANFLFNESLNLGVNYRWDDSVSAILGFQISTRFNIGYAYDYSITDLNNYNSGSHEIFLRYQWISRTTRLKSPRFF
ncbi:MAG: type IX secretion system membrane protein PorP/SprF [Bacteroidota bacterium]